MQTDSLQAIILAITQVQAVGTVLKLVVEGLARQPEIALARIWLISPGDDYLHLVASEGKPSEPGADWSRLDGEFSRFSLNEKKIGRIGATGESILLSILATQETSEGNDYIAHPEWARREGIRSFAGHPLVFRDEILGVLAVFSRAHLSETDFAWLRAYADHAAVAIANARAFEEIDQLRHKLEMENVYLREEVRAALDFGDLVGQSPVLQKVLRQIELVAQTETSVLILGESGTGKELVARAIHERSLRRMRPMIRVNCGSIPHELFESEFFGHVKGAFTGAIRDRVGRFQLADGGTLFLDEVGEIPLWLQSKLLRVLQEGEFERVGEERTRRVDVRIVAATNRDLRREVDQGRFRPDLYYRLSVFPIEVPPLRERKDDIGLLAAHFINRSCSRLNCAETRLTNRIVQQLQAYDWPGNIRELQNVIERAVILSGGGPLKLDHTILDAPTAKARRDALAEASITYESNILTIEELKQLERDNIRRALERANQKIYGAGGAAELLGMRPTTLASRMRALGINRRGAP
ncbi:MAG TPA: sigma 54-interacting transcriptional regulator [Pyrinomonadaceae bacterium]|jgi:transcriptional regulator with GAF, ATPase, and Fis domain|nr:sigma 54-interacting transcriptional regulator [Pyrinomonadaceae bacterium]